MVNIYINFMQIAWFPANLKLFMTPSLFAPDVSPFEGPVRDIPIVRYFKLLTFDSYFYFGNIFKGVDESNYFNSPRMTLTI